MPEDVEAVGEVNAEPAEQTNEVDIESIKAELVKAQEKTKEWEDTAKRHQKAALEKGKQAADWQGKVDKLELKIDTMAEIMEANLFRETEEIEPQKKPTYKERVKEKESLRQTESNQTVDQYTTRIAAEIAQLTKSAGIEDNDERLTKAENKWFRKDYDGALEEVRKVTKEVEKKEPEESFETKFERAYQERRKKERLDSGELNAETGQPNTTSANVAQIRKNYRDNPHDPKAVKEYLEWKRGGG